MSGGWWISPIGGDLTGDGGAGGRQVLLVGDSSVGKSSLLLRFTADQFVSSTNPTIGAFQCNRRPIWGDAAGWHLGGSGALLIACGAHWSPSWAQVLTSGQNTSQCRIRS